MRKEDICIRIPSEVEARMLHRLLTDAGEKIASRSRLNAIKSIDFSRYTYCEFYNNSWILSDNDEDKKSITIYRLRELLGLAPQMGRRPKYAEPTRCVSFKVPISKIEAIKAIVREELAKVEIKKEK